MGTNKGNPVIVCPMAWKGIGVCTSELASLSQEENQLNLNEQTEGLSVCPGAETYVTNVECSGMQEHKHKARPELLEQGSTKQCEKGCQK